MRNLCQQLLPWAAKTCLVYFIKISIETTLILIDFSFPWCFWSSPQQKQFIIVHRQSICDYRAFDLPQYYDLFSMHDRNPLILRHVDNMHKNNAPVRVLVKSKQLCGWGRANKLNILLFIICDFLSHQPKMYGENNSTSPQNDPTSRQLSCLSLELDHNFWSYKSMTEVTTLFAVKRQTRVHQTCL